MGFAQFSADPVFAQKIKMFFALAPVSTVGYVTSNLRKVAPFTSAIYAVLDTLGIASLGSLSWLVHFIEPSCDYSNPVSEALCNSLINLIVGPLTGGNLNATRVPVYLSHNPAGESVQDVVHFGQMVNSKKMQKFDFGTVQNLIKYHQLSPPVYNVAAMKVPAVLYWSLDDNSADPDDVGLLLQKLTNQHQAIQVPGYSHVDFIWAVDARRYIYDGMIAIMKQNV